MKDINKGTGPKHQASASDDPAFRSRRQRLLQPTDRPTMDAINATSQCIFCEHFKGARTCEAFPDLDNEAGAIPLPIFDGEFDHRQPWPGDGGIRWEPKAPGTTPVGFPPAMAATPAPPGASATIDRPANPRQTTHCRARRTAPARTHKALVTPADSITSIPRNPAQSRTISRARLHTSGLNVA